VLAGLINNEDRKTADKVPGLGELPGLKRVFGSSMDADKRSEIVLSITPRIVRNSQRPEGRFSEFRSGTESRAFGGGGTASGALGNPNVTVSVLPSLAPPPAALARPAADAAAAPVKP
jgi:general secretion pathway protein D